MSRFETEFEFDVPDVEEVEVVDYGPPENHVRSDFDYGPLKFGKDYPILQKGVDWLLVKAKGKSVHVPFHVFQAER